LVPTSQRRGKRDSDRGKSSATLSGKQEVRDYDKFWNSRLNAEDHEKANVPIEIQ